MMFRSIARPVLLLFTFSMLFVAGVGQGFAQTDQRCFEETGYCIEGRIREYWEQNGGLPVFGLPITPQREEMIEGQPFQVQWFERNRLELHPENQRPYDVLLGRLGVDVMEKHGRDWQAEFSRAEPQDGCQYFEETGHNVCGEIYSAWRANGLELDGARGYSEQENMALFGLPLSEAHTEMINGQEYTVQWFERARFELHPENEPPYNVLLGLLGNEMEPPASAPEPAPEPAPADGWQTVAPPEGRFSVEMPGTPTQQNSQLDTELGTIDFIYHMLEANNGNVAYMVAYSDYPANTIELVDPNELLNTSVDGGIASMGFTVDSKEPTSIDGYPGLTATATGNFGGKPAVLHGRYYLVNNRLYQVVVAGTNEFFSQADADRFLNSFALAN